MRRIYLVSLVGIILQTLIMSGCISSTVKYKSDIQADKEGLIKFYLKSSNITLSRKVTASKGKSASTDPVLTSLATISDISCSEASECFKDVQAIVTPKEYTKGKLYAIVPQENLWGATNLSVSYVGETHLIKKIGVEVIDHRKDYIQAVGALITAGITVGVFEKLPEQISVHLPVVIDVDEAREKNTWQQLSTDNKNWWFRLVINSQKPIGTIETETFFSDFISTSTSVLGFSSCREATLYLYHDNLQPSTDMVEGPIKFPVTIVDPTQLETLKLPNKGNITMHDLCGADLETQSSSIPSGGSLLIDAINQVSAIKKAQDQVKQSVKTSGGNK